MLEPKTCQTIFISNDNSLGFSTFNKSIQLPKSSSFDVQPTGNILKDLNVLISLLKTILFYCLYLPFKITFLFLFKGTYSGIDNGSLGLQSIRCSLYQSFYFNDRYPAMSIRCTRAVEFISIVLSPQCLGANTYICSSFRDSEIAFHTDSSALNFIVTSLSDLLSKIF